VPTSTVVVGEVSNGGGIGIGRVVQLVMLGFVLVGAGIVWFAWRGRIRE
jgi:hypothetical protein